MVLLFLLLLLLVLTVLLLLVLTVLLLLVLTVLSQIMVLPLLIVLQQNEILHQRHVNFHRCHQEICAFGDWAAKNLVTD